ncbi:disease resistance protein RPP13-like [Carex rostrata]
MCTRPTCQRTNTFARDEFTLADLNHMPEIYLFLKTPKADLINSRPHVKAWWEVISARDAWKKTAASMPLVSCGLCVAKALADPLLKKTQELQAVSGQIKQMQKELRLIQAYLRDADSKSNKNESVKEWVNQVRDIAHRIEDVIDTFLVEIEENHPWYRKIYMWLKIPCKIYKLSGDLKEITQDLKKIYQLRINLEITIRGADNQQIGRVPFRPTKPTDVDESEVVGLENDKQNIIKKLLETNISRRMVLSIVGTGGLGKTTLALKVFKSAELERHFDCRTWVSISQKFNINDIFRKILYSIEPTMENKNPPVTDENLPAELQKSLTSNRYLIILDDVWRDSDWEQLKNGLPDPKNASRVIITSRSVDVALTADCNTQPYNLRYLNDDESIALLFRKAFQQHIQPENYPRDLLNVAEKLTKKCGGLPLALVVLGGILSRKERNYIAWSTTEETMNWHDEDGKKCSQVLAMSYEDLPYQLKPCFLYFASFPEDYKISGEHITSMWMAEGFIPKDSARTIEDRAKKCLEELVQRCLIQVTKKSWNGYCKYCNMHDLLRDLAITKAKEENFFTVFSKEGEDVNQLCAIKPRRAALQFSTLTQHGVYSENTRSLLCFDFGRSSLNDCGFSKLNYSGFSLLRVLTLQSVDMTEFTHRQWPKGLVHLRYLGLRCCRIPVDFFKKFSFYNLETIDLKESDTVYDDIIVLDVLIPTLKHVYGNLDFYFRLKWNQHTNLQTLKYVWIHPGIVELECCINLRTLVISFKGSIDNERAQQMWPNFKAVLRRTEQLVHLGILQNRLLPFGGTTDLPCHGKIQNLYLDGEWIRDICVPSVEMFPPNLTKLTLKWSKLEKDPMPILEKLLSLRILHLGARSYLGTKLICSTGGFPNLEILRLQWLPSLCHWDIEEGAMPVVRHLIIYNCERLNALPELQKVLTLQELVVNYPSREVRESMQGDKDLHKH